MKNWSNVITGVKFSCTADTQGDHHNVGLRLL